MDQLISQNPEIVALVLTLSAVVVMFAFDRLYRSFPPDVLPIVDALADAMFDHADRYVTLTPSKLDDKALAWLMEELQALREKKSQ